MPNKNITGFSPGKPSVASEPAAPRPPLPSKQEQYEGSSLYRFAGSADDNVYPEGHLDDRGTDAYPGYVSVDVPSENLAGRWLVSPEYPGVVFRSRGKITNDGSAVMRVSAGGPANASFQEVDVATAENVRKGGMSPSDIEAKLSGTDRRLAASGASLADREFVRGLQEQALKEKLKKQHGIEATNEEIFVARKKAALAARAQMEADPYKYFLRNPAVNDLVEAANDPNNFGARQELDRAVLALQQQAGLPKNKWNVMAEDDVQTFIGALDDPDTPTVEVIQRVIAVEERFGENTELALKQLSRSGAGRGVVDRIRPLLWHSDNPAMLKSLASGMLRPDELRDVETREFKEEGEKRKFERDALNTPGMRAYRATYSGFEDGRRQDTGHVAAVAKTFITYAKAMKAKGFSIKDSSDRFFSAFRSLELDQGTLLMPGVVGGKRVTEEEAKQATAHLDSLQLDVVSSLQNGEPLRVAGRTVKVLPPVGGLSQSLGLDTPAALADMAIDAFWVPSTDQKGVLLAVEGINGEAVPLRMQGVRRDGKPGVVTDFFVPYEQAILGNTIRQFRNLSPFFLFSQHPRL